MIKKYKNGQLVCLTPFEFKDAGTTQEGEIPDWIHVVPIGQWSHAEYGKMIITSSDIADFVSNFEAGLRKGVFITAGHEGFKEQPAVGWIMEVQAREDGLWGRVDWTNLGKETLNDKQFKFFSPEFYSVYEDPETHEMYKNVLTGGALTKSPYFKELEAVVFSEKINKSNQQSMTIEEVLAKSKEDLTQEEKDFLKANQSELSEDQKKDYEDVLGTGEDGGSGEEEEKDGDGGENKENTTDESGEGDGGESVEEKVETSEKKGMRMVKASYLQSLEEKANAGAKAFAELRKKSIQETASAMIYSESNKDGKFLVKASEKLESFIGSLDEKQLATFKELISGMPKMNLFGEVGKSEDTTNTAQSQIDAKVSEKMKADDKMKYADALRVVLSENPDLAKQLEEEN